MENRQFPLFFVISISLDVTWLHYRWIYKGENWHLYALVDHGALNPLVDIV